MIGVGAWIAGVVLFSIAALSWPLTIKPALRRKYERDHQRRKRNG